MARKEERKQRAKEIFDLPQCQALFMCGAEWADKTMIEKSCEWLKNNMHNYLVAKADGADYRITIFNDFKKAMMEE